MYLPFSILADFSFLVNVIKHELNLWIHEYVAISLHLFSSLELRRCAAVVDVWFLLFGSAVSSWLPAGFP